MMSNTGTPTLGRAGLVILLAGQLLPMIDFSIVNVALDAMSSSLHASPIGLELIVAIYGIAFAVSLAMGGRFGDNFGRRRAFLCGVALFGIASLLCGLAGSVTALLIARALQGVGAALIVPQILATLHVTLQGQAHSRAISLYGGIGGLAFVVGQVLGGFLIAADIGGYGWRSVFLINLPICLLILLAGGRMLPDTRKQQRVPFDIQGTLLLALAVGCLLTALALGPLLHWSWPCIALLCAFPLLLRQLLRVERRLEQQDRHPLLPPSLMRLPNVRFGLAIAILFFSCWSGFMFAVALTLQSGLGLSPLQSGNAFITLGLSYFAGSLCTARAAIRLGRNGSLLMGCLVQMSGLVVLIASFIWGWQQMGVLLLIPASLLIGFGQAFVVGSFYRIGLADIPHHHAGEGSAMLSTVQQSAFGLGPMLLGSVYSQFLQWHGDYQSAVVAALVAEFVLMLLLVMRVLSARARCPAPAA